MTKSAIAKEKFTCNNCAQSVFAAFAPDFGLDESMALRIAANFGSGMAMGETCGAVTGAYMTLGLKLRKDGKTVQELKAESKANVRRFNQLFIEKHGSLNCKKLVGFDLSTQEGTDAAREAGAFDTICSKLVESAAEILENEF